MEDILVATDGSPDAFFAVEEAVWIAKHVGAEVVSVAVAKPLLTSATSCTRRRSWRGSPPKPCWRLRRTV